MLCFIYLYCTCACVYVWDHIMWWQVSRIWNPTHKAWCHLYYFCPHKSGLMIQRRKTDTHVSRAGFWNFHFQNDIFSRCSLSFRAHPLTLKLVGCEPTADGPEICTTLDSSRALEQNENALLTFTDSKPTFFYILSHWKCWRRWHWNQPVSAGKQLLSNHLTRV